MKYYIDIKLLPDADISLGFLWRKVYQLTHEALAYAKKNKNISDRIAFSFPNYKKEIFPMGDILRVFSTSKNELETVNIATKLAIVLDYVEVSDILKIPLETKNVKFVSHKPKLNFLQRVQKQAKRHNVSFEESLKHFKNSKYANDKKFDKILSLPYVILDSGETKQTYTVFIEKIVVEEEIKGTFNTFGLSKTATVPWF